MKKLRVTVKGISYEVWVEVLEDDSPNEAAALPAPAAIRRQPTESPRQSSPGLITAPIAGTIQKVFVEAGQDVEEKVPLILLDAMKMDTYIYSPQRGRIGEVWVAPGDTVQVGAQLIRYDAEA